MNIAERIFSRWGFVNEKQFNAKLQEAVKAEIDKKLPRWLGETADAAKFDMPDPAVFANQADMYRLSPLLGTAVDMLASDVGTAKLNVKRRVGEEMRDIKNHPYELLLRNPNPADSGLELAQYTVSNYLLNGNAVRWLNRASAADTPAEIWPIPFSMIEVVPDKKMYISHYNYFPGAGKPPIRLETWEIVHYKTYNPNNRFIGLSKLESIAMTLQGDLAMRKTNTVNYAEYGGAPQSILAFKEFPADDTWKDIKSETRQAAKRNEMMMLRGVGDGVTWMQRALSSKDMDFLAGLKQNMEDTFNRMCPGLLAMLSEGATYSNASAARATYSESTLWPVMEVLAQKDTSDVLPAYGRNLMCIYDDPRFVDKQVLLQERTADEKIMTLSEIRKEYKQLDPLGDERDGLLIAQINAQTGKPEPVQPVPAQLPQTDEQAVEIQDEGVDEKPVQEEFMAQKADLMRWKRYALRTFGKASKPFESLNIPDELAQEINAKLAACKSAGEVADVFEEVKPTHAAPAGNTDAIKALAATIEKALAEAVKAEAPMVQPNINVTMPAISLTAQMPPNGTVVVNVPEQPPPNVTVKNTVQAAPPAVNNVTVQPAAVVIPPMPTEAVIETMRNGDRKLKVK